jgi:hypothetical protein
VDPRILGAGFRIAVLILGTSLVTLPFQRAGSAEQVVTVLAALVGLLFTATVLAMARLGAGRPPLSRDDKSRPRTLNERFQARPPQHRKAEGDR